MNKKNNPDLLKISHYMKLNNISRDKMAEILKVTPVTITNITSGKTYPSIDLLLEIAEIFNIDIRELFNPTKVNYSSQLIEAKTLIKKGVEILEKL